MCNIGIKALIEVAVNHICVYKVIHASTQMRSASTCLIGSLTEILAKLLQAYKDRCHVL